MGPASENTLSNVAFWLLAECHQWISMLLEPDRYLDLVSWCCRSGQSYVSMTFLVSRALELGLVAGVWLG